MKTRIFRQVADVPQRLWENPDSPFTAQAYWQALSDNQLIGEGTDWDSRYIVVLDHERAVAMQPVFIKSHHQGEYVFDHAWAHAFHRYGINYYPRLVTSVPFTPVVGQRIWLAAGAKLTSELVGLLNHAIHALAIEHQAPTWHALFIESKQKKSWQDATRTATHHSATLSRQEEAQYAKQPAVSAQHTAYDTELLERHGCQFLWSNQTVENTKFADFDDFLAKLTAKKRKNIRAERRKVAGAGVRCQWKLGSTLGEISNEHFASNPIRKHTDITLSSEPITQDDWKTFYHCYAMTYAVRGQQPYLNLSFFTQLAHTMPEHLALAQAINEKGDIVACSLFFYDTHRLYGRYWGTLENINFLHFELCYYQGISFAIALGLTHFDPGTQGEHKLIRGFEPVISHSLHKVFVPEFVPAIREFCTLEQADVAHYAKAAADALPFKQVD